MRFVSGMGMSLLGTSTISARVLRLRRRLGEARARSSCLKLVEDGGRAWGSSKERKGDGAARRRRSPAWLRRGGPSMVEEKGKILHGLVRESGLE